MTTLVVCVDRSGDVARVADRTPAVGEEAVRSLVTEVGVADPEDSYVNCLLEALRVARELRADGEEAVVASISATGETVSADRAVARQIDDLVDEYGPDSAVVVTDSAEDERLLPIVESRVRVDGVDRVVVRQARDIESTYYLMKQFLADEELRATVLVPIGVALLAFPVFLLLANSIAVTVATITGVIGLFLLYKGLGVDDYVAALPGAIREALYSGQVALVTYVVGGGLALVGLFAGGIGVSSMDDAAVLLLAIRFAFDAVPWLAMAALAASTGRLLDELIRNEGVRSSYLNLPFGVVAVGLVVRGFSAYFLELAAVIEPLSVPAMRVGSVAVRGFPLPPGTRLAAFVVAGVLISLVGVRFASYLSETTIDEELPE